MCFYYILTIKYYWTRDERTVATNIVVCSGGERLISVFLSHLETPVLEARRTDWVMEVWEVKEVKEVKEVGERRTHFRNLQTRPQCRAESWRAPDNLMKYNSKESPVIVQPVRDWGLTSVRVLVWAGVVWRRAGQIQLGPQADIWHRQY